MCTLNFHIGWIIFLHFIGFWLFLIKSFFFITRNSVLKVMKNLLKHWKCVVFLNWKFLFTDIIYNTYILNEFC